jgi:hypothetical protein
MHFYHCFVIIAFSSSQPPPLLDPFVEPIQAQKCGGLFQHQILAWQQRKFFSIHGALVQMLGTLTLLPETRGGKEIFRMSNSQTG